MSATLALLLKQLEPDWKIVTLTSEQSVIIKSPGWRKKGDEILASYMKNMYHVILQGSLLTNYVFHGMSPWVFFSGCPDMWANKGKKPGEWGIWQLVWLPTVDGITTAGCWEQFHPKQRHKVLFLQTYSKNFPPCQNAF